MKIPCWLVSQSSPDGRCQLKPLLDFCFALKRLGFDINNQWSHHSQGEKGGRTLYIIATIQREVFDEELKSLKSKKEIKPRDKSSRLNPFLDKRGVLRVEGQLEHADLHPNIKHPAILPSKAHMSKLHWLITCHQVYHQGNGITMNGLQANGQ